MTEIVVVTAHKPDRVVVRGSGTQGPPGPQGIQGVQGIQGPQGAPGELTAANLPAVVENLARDPEMRAAGGSNNGAVWTAPVLVSDVVPSASSARSRRTTRTADASNPTILASLVLTPFSAGDPLRVRVDPLKTYSVGVKVRTDYTSGYRASVVVNWRNAAGGLLATYTGPIREDIPADTWHEASVERVVAPATAEFMHVFVNAFTPVGAVASITGAQTWVGEVQVTETPRVLTYGSGDTAGWRWSGTAHQSTSIRWSPLPARDVLVRDTGLRNIGASLTFTNILNNSTSALSRIRRIGDVVSIYLSFEMGTSPPSPTTVYELPPGFRQPFQKYGPNGYSGKPFVWNPSIISVYSGTSGFIERVSDQWITEDPWPRVLPGTAV